MSTANNTNNYEREVSCRLVNSYIAFVRHTGKDVTALLSGLPHDKEFFTNTSNWISLELARELQRRLREMYHDDEILYKVGCSIEELHSVGFMDIVARLMNGPQYVIKNAPRLHRYLSNVNEIDVVHQEKGGATLKFYPKDGYTVSPDSCHFLRGLFTSVPAIWGAQKAEVVMEMCAVPIQEMRVFNNRRYDVDTKGYVTEHVVVPEGGVTIPPRVIGRVSEDGTFVLNNTMYGAPYCLFHIYWDERVVWFKKIFYNIIKRPTILKKSIEEIQRQNDLLQEKYDEVYFANIQLQQHYIDTINSLVRAIDAKDHYTQGHSSNVCGIAELIAKELGIAADEIETIKVACQLHDIGKIGVSDAILLKPGRLNEEEWAEIKKHPLLGYEIIKPLSFLRDVADLVRHDHERWDGNGYPDGLSGEDIELGARIIMVADAYDAMVSGRVYRRALSKQEVLDEFRKNAGGQFDPSIAQLFITMLEALPGDEIF